MAGRPSANSMLRRYEKSHRHPVNQFAHLLAIPMVALSVPLAVLSLFLPPVRFVARRLLLLGWLLQLLGHAFERKPPESLRDWRFSLVSLRWWVGELSERM